MTIGLRSASKAAIRLARLTPRLLSLLVASMLGTVAVQGAPPQPDDERRTEVVYRHFV